MLVAIAYHAGDLHLAQQLAAWMRSLGPYPGHSMLVARDISTEAKPFEGIGFDSVTEIIVRDDTWKRWPESPNNAFAKIAKHIEYTKPESWLWLEPDAVPMRRGWLDALVEEWRNARKHFMGGFVPGIEGSPDHMSGIGSYPGKLTHHAGNAVIAMEIPWDLAAASQIVPKAHFTKLIKHNWRPPEFLSMADVAAEIPPECVLYHKDKSGNVIRLLRENLPVPVLAKPPNAAVPLLADGVPAGMQARESTSSKGNPESRNASEGLDSRGGQFISKEPGPVDPPNAAADHGSGAGNSSQPWANRDLSEQAIKRLCQELRRYCTAPRYTAAVRHALAVSGVTATGFKPRRRKRK